MTQLSIIWEGAAQQAWRRDDRSQPREINEAELPTTASVMALMDAGLRDAFVDGFKAGAEFERARAQEDS